MLHIKHKRSLFPSQALLFFVTKVALFRHKRSFIVTNVLLSSQTFFYRHNRSFIVTNVLLSSQTFFYRHKRCSFSTQTLFFFVTNAVIFCHKRCCFSSQTFFFGHKRFSFSSHTFFFVTNITSAWPEQLIFPEHGHELHSDDNASSFLQLRHKPQRCTSAVTIYSI